MDENVEAETSQDGVFELGVLVHDDRHDAHVGQEATSPTDNVFSGINF